MRRRLVTQTVTGLNFSDTLGYAVNQEIDRFYYKIGRFSIDQFRGNSREFG